MNRIIGLERVIMDDIEKLVNDYIKKGGKIQKIKSGQESEEITYKYKRRRLTRKAVIKEVENRKD